MSEAHANTGGWSANPLLNGKSQAPNFLRTQWDKAKVRSFGPWRVADRTEPTDALTLQALLTVCKVEDNNKIEQDGLYKPNLAASELRYNRDWDQ